MGIHQTITLPNTLVPTPLPGQMNSQLSSTPDITAGDTAAKGFGKRLRQARRDAGMTPARLAKLSGVDVGAIRTMEKMGACYGIEPARDLAGALTVDMTWLWLGREVAPVGAAHVVPIVVGDDAELIALCDRILANMDELDAEPDDIPPNDPRWDEVVRQREAIRHIVPTSFAGHRRRATAYLRAHGGVGGNGEPASYLDGQDLWPILRDLASDTALMPAAASHAPGSAAAMGSQIAKLQLEQDAIQAKCYRTREENDRSDEVLSSCSDLSDAIVTSAPVTASDALAVLMNAASNVLGAIEVCSRAEIVTKSIVAHDAIRSAVGRLASLHGIDLKSIGSAYVYDSHDRLKERNVGLTHEAAVYDALSGGVAFRLQDDDVQTFIMSGTDHAEANALIARLNPKRLVSDVKAIAYRTIHDPENRGYALMKGKAYWISREALDKGTKDLFPVVATAPADHSALMARMADAADLEVKPLRVAG